MIFLLQGLLVSDKLSDSIKSFYSKISSKTGTTEKILSDKEFLPHPYTFLLIGFALIVIVALLPSLFGTVLQISYISHEHGGPASLTAIFSILLTCILASIVLMGVVYWSMLSRGPLYEAIQRRKGYLLNLTIGSYLIWYPLAFIVIAIFFSLILRERGWLPATLAGLILLGFFMVVWYVLSMRMLTIPASIAKILADRTDSSSFPKASLASNKKPHTFLIMASTFWSAYGLLNAGGFFLAFLALRYALLGKSSFFLEKILGTTFDAGGIAGFFSRLICIVYAIPFLAIFCVFIFKWFGEFIDIGKSQINPASKKLQKFLRQICDFISIRSPQIIVDNSPFITSNVSYVLGVGGVLRISNGVLRLLQDDELQAILAHEIHHLERHSSRFWWADFLSEWTLFGKGCLAMTYDSRQIEFECDEFAVRYLTSNGIRKTALIKALNKAVIANSMLEHLAPSKSMLSFVDSGLPIKEDKINTKEKLKWLYELFFGDLIISYIHPTIEERIKRIEAL